MQIVLYNESLPILNELEIKLGGKKMKIDVLKQHGIDYHRGVRRFMDDSELYESMLIHFVEKHVLGDADAAFAAKNWPELFFIVHEIKGVSGNLDMTNLFEDATSLCALLRNDEDEDTANEAEYSDAYLQFKKSYQVVFDGITEAMK